MIRGTAADISVSAKELIRLRKKSIDLYSRETGRPVEQIEKELVPRLLDERGRGRRVQDRRPHRPRSITEVDVPA